MRTSSTGTWNSYMPGWRSSITTVAGDPAGTTISHSTPSDKAGSRETDNPDDRGMCRTCPLRKCWNPLQWKEDEIKHNIMEGRDDGTMKRNIMTLNQGQWRACPRWHAAANDRNDGNDNANYHPWYMTSADVRLYNIYLPAPHQVTIAVQLPYFQ